MSTHDGEYRICFRGLYVKIFYRCFVCTSQEFLITLIESHAVYPIAEASVLSEDELVVKLEKLDAARLLTCQ